MPKEAVVVGEAEQAAEPEQAGPPVALRVRAGQAAARRAQLRYGGK
jgi:hypothetical protein